MYLEDICTVPANLAGIPGISIPAGMSSDNLPIGLQLLGPAMGEETLLRPLSHSNKHVQIVN